MRTLKANLSKSQMIYDKLQVRAFISNDSLKNIKLVLKEANLELSDDLFFQDIEVATAFITRDNHIFEPVNVFIQEEEVIDVTNAYRDLEGFQYNIKATFSALDYLKGIEFGCAC